jgi:hypothetical protein
MLSLQALLLRDTAKPSFDFASFEIGEIACRDIGLRVLSPGRSFSCPPRTLRQNVMPGTSRGVRGR